MTHEQSETIQQDDGRWINVYGKGTKFAGQQLPNTISYNTQEEAVKSAEKRSKNSGLRFGIQPSRPTSLPKRVLDPDDDEVDMSERYSFMQKLNASMQIINPLSKNIGASQADTLWGQLADMFGPEPDFPKVDGYEPSPEETKGFAGHTLDYLIMSRSPEQFEWRLQEAKRMMEMRRISQESGWTGILGILAGSFGNPIVMVPAIVPLSGPFTWGRVAGEMFIVGGAEVASETLLYDIDPTRTKWESAGNILGATVLTGILGSTIRHFTKDQLDVLSKKFVDDVLEPPPAPPKVAPGSREPTGEPGVRDPVRMHRPPYDESLPDTSRAVAGTPQGPPGGVRAPSGDVGARIDPGKMVEAPILTWDEAMDRARVMVGPEPKFQAKKVVQTEKGLATETVGGESIEAWEKRIVAKAKEIFEEANKVPEELPVDQAAKVTAKGVVEDTTKPTPDDIIAVTMDATESVNDVAKQFKGNRQALEKEIRHLVKSLDDETLEKVNQLIEPIRTQDLNWNLAVLHAAIDRVNKAIPKETLAKTTAEAPPVPNRFNWVHSAIGETVAEMAVARLFNSLPFDKPIPISRVLNTLARHVENPWIKKLVDKLKSLDLNVRVILTPELIGSNGKSAPGGYRVYIGEITGESKTVPGGKAGVPVDQRAIVIRAGADDSNFVRTFLHEAVHAATMHGLHAKSPVLAGITKLYNFAKELARKEGLKTGEGTPLYGLKNTDEFIAEAYSNPAFRSWLKSQHLPEERASLWDSIVSMVGRFLGLNSAPGKNLLDDVLEIGDQAFITEKQIQDIGDQQLPVTLVNYNKLRAEQGLDEIGMDEPLVKMDAELPDSVPASTSSFDEKAAASKLDVPESLGSVSSIGNPLVRLATSPSSVVRMVNEMLNELPIQQAKNRIGLKTEQAVETLIKAWNGPLGGTIIKMRELYSDYVGITGNMRFQRAWVKGKSDESIMSWKQFKEAVGESALTGMPKSNRFVQAAAKEWTDKILEPLKKQGLETGLLNRIYQHPKRGRILFAMYDYTKITKDANRFVEDITQWLLESRITSDPIKAKASANRVLDEITSVNFTTGVPKEVLAVLPQAENRNLRVPIPPEVMQQWAMKDMELMGRMWVRRMATEVEIFKKFGDSNLSHEFDAVKRHYRQLASKPGANTEKLNKRQKQDLRDLNAILGIYRGTYGVPSDPTSGLVRAGRMLRTWQYVVALGAQMISASPDMVRPVVTNGVLPYLSALPRFITKPRLAIADAKALGQGYEMVLHGRVAAMADVHDIPTVYGKVEKVSDIMAGTFGKVSLMDPWNAFFKQLSSVMAANRIFKLGLKGWDNISAKQQEQLLWLGINKGDLEKIMSQAMRHGTKDRGFLVGNVHLWGKTDNPLVRTEGEYARRVLSAAVNKEADTLIVTAGKADRPLIFHTEVGKVIGQFMAFITSSTNRMLLTNISKRDLDVLNSIVGGTILGALAVYIKRSISDQPMPDNPVSWAGYSIGQAGLFGAPGEVLGIGGELFGLGIYQKPAKEILAERLVGASLSTMTNLTQLTQGLGSLAMGEQWKEHQTHAARQLIPYQNVWYIRKLFDVSEEGINEAIGAKKSKTRRKRGKGIRPLSGF